jgi:hypothetical protein
LFLRVNCRPTFFVSQISIFEVNVVACRIEMDSTIAYERAQPMNDREIRKIEKLTGFILPPELKAFFNSYAGAQPTIKGSICLIDIVHDDGWKQESFVNRIDSLSSIKISWKNIAYLQDFQRDFDLSPKYVEAKKLLPIMELGGGHLYMAIGGLHAGKIYSCDNGDFGIILVAKSLDQLIGKFYKE